MALRIEYETHYGITCEYAHCIVRDARVNKEREVTEDSDGNEVVTTSYPINYSGKRLYRRFITDWWIQW